MLPEDRGAVVDFDSFARLFQSLTSDKARAEGGDRPDRLERRHEHRRRACTVGINALAPSSRPAPRQDHDPAHRRRRLVEPGADRQSPSRQRITIYTIGLGSDIDEPLLRVDRRRAPAASTSTSPTPPTCRTSSARSTTRSATTEGHGRGRPDGLRGGGGRARQPSASTSSSRPTRASRTPTATGSTDGDEVNVDDRFESRATSSLYPVFSDPRNVDTDERRRRRRHRGRRGLAGTLERDRRRRARRPGRVRDRHRPDVVDTDGDGYGDGPEHLDRDGGFDPLVPTEVLSGWDYAGALRARSDVRRAVRLLQARHGRVARREHLRRPLRGHGHPRRDRPALPGRASSARASRS